MITMDHAGNWSMWLDFNSYMNNQPQLIGSVLYMCGDRLEHNTSSSPDFTTISAPFTLRASVNPYWL